MLHSVLDVAAVILEIRWHICLSAAVVMRHLGVQDAEKPDYESLMQ